MNLNGYTRTCGLIGNPVEHTMSPLIQNDLAKRLGENLVYVPFHVENGRLEDAVKGAYALNLLGCNVTVPYKSECIPYLTELDPLAERIGAVNTLVRRPGGFKGYNTDMPGLYRALSRDGVKLEGEQVVLLGAGGAARAVAVLMAEKGVSQLFLFNRTLQRAAALAEEVNAMTGKNLAQAHGLQEWPQVLSVDRKYLAVQTTNVGMYPKTEEVLIGDPDFYQRIHTGYDLIFNPASTRFMKMVQAAGGRAFNGLGMLLYQGVTAFELWTGRTVEESLANEIYQKLTMKN